jgi:hypothetical protein
VYEWVTDCGNKEAATAATDELLADVLLKAEELAEFETLGPQVSPCRSSLKRSQRANSWLKRIESTVDFSDKALPVVGVEGILSVGLEVIFNGVP